MAASEVMITMIRWILILVLLSSPEAFADFDDLGAALVGAYGTVFIHESGHALTVLALGESLEFFRPYPSKTIWQLPDGRTEEKWTVGLVKFKVTDKSDSNKKIAWISAMGSGGNALGVLLLSPLLPKASGFTAKALDDMLGFATFDAPVYIISDLLGNQGDWSQVSKATGISLYWWLTGAIGGSLLLNQYRVNFRNQAPQDSVLKSTPLTVVSTKLSF